MPEEPTDIDELEDADELTPIAGGRIRMRVNGTLFVLRPPNMGQIRRYRERYLEILSDARDFFAAQEDDTPGDDTSGSVRSLDALATHVAATVGYEKGNEEIAELVGEIVGDLDRGGRKLPGGDDLPQWVGQYAVVSTMIGHWQRIPQAPGR